MDLNQASEQELQEELRKRMTQRVATALQDVEAQMQATILKERLRLGDDEEVLVSLHSLPVGSLFVTRERYTPETTYQRTYKVQNCPTRNSVGILDVTNGDIGMVWTRSGGGKYINYLVVNGHQLVLAAGDVPRWHDKVIPLLYKG